VQAWEYRLITITTEMEKDKEEHWETAQQRDLRIENALGAMGSDGWELVSFLPVATITKAAHPWMYHAVFKRPTP
jgi:hypothetical protein